MIVANLGHLACQELMIVIALSKFLTYSVYIFKNGAKLFIISPGSKAFSNAQNLQYTYFLWLENNLHLFIYQCTDFLWIIFQSDRTYTSISTIYHHYKFPSFLINFPHRFSCSVPTEPYVPQAVGEGSHGGVCRWTWHWKTSGGWCQLERGGVLGSLGRRGTGTPSDLKTLVKGDLLYLKMMFYVIL